MTRNQSGTAVQLSLTIDMSHSPSYHSVAHQLVLRPTNRCPLGHKTKLTGISGQDRGPRCYKSTHTWPHNRGIAACPAG
jgi:hypothetical protein